MNDWAAVPSPGTTIYDLPCEVTQNILQQLRRKETIDVLQNALNEDYLW